MNDVEESLVEPCPQKFTVNPEKAPIKGSSFRSGMKTNIAQEIKRRYYNMPLSNAKHQKLPIGTHSASHTKRSASRQHYNDYTTPTYMKQTTIMEVRKSQDPSEMPERVRKLVLEKEKKLRDECTFKPQISASEYDEKLELNKRERQARLYKPKAVDIEKREKLKRQQDDEEFNKACTFKPKRIAKSISYAKLRPRTSTYGNN
jgi:hypothetical protein